MDDVLAADMNMVRFPSERAARPLMERVRAIEPEAWDVLLSPALQFPSAFFAVDASVVQGSGG